MKNGKCRRDIYIYIYIYMALFQVPLDVNYHGMGKGVSPVGTSLPSTLRKPEFVLTGSV
jgi:hypothetical protein